MGTPFIVLLEPHKLDGYKPGLPYSEQPSHIPTHFQDAMKVRERVFVQEQGCPLKFEHDADDARSCHWIIYASKQTKAQPEERNPETLEMTQPRYSSTETITIGTIRITPFPHLPHPLDGARYTGGVLQTPEDVSDEASSSDPKHNGAQGDNDETQESSSPNGKDNGHDTTAATEAPPSPPSPPQHEQARTLFDERRMSAPVPFGPDRQTDYHNGKEPYVKLGRLAVLPEYRHYRIADQLWDAAKEWLEKNHAYFNPSIKEMGMDVMRVDNISDVPEWNGLVCVHARETETKVYERWGFELDKGMGKFYYDDVLHVGMWKRLRIKPSKPMTCVPRHR